MILTYYGNKTSIASMCGELINLHSEIYQHIAYVPSPTMFCGVSEFQLYGPGGTEIGVAPVTGDSQKDMGPARYWGATLNPKDP